MAIILSFASSSVRLHHGSEYDLSCSAQSTHYSPFQMAKANVLANR